MPSSETILNRSLHVLFCLFLSDDLNYLIITIGYLHWKMNCFRHRRNFSPSPCSESLPLQWQHRADIPSQLGTSSSWALHVAQRCLHGSPRQGEIHWCCCACGAVARGQSQDPHGSVTLLPTWCRKCHQSPSPARSSKEFLSDV